jgi:itaconate CoA-transferase
MLGLQNEREWNAFCEKVLRQPQLALEPRFASNKQRTAARDELYALIVATFSTLTAQQVSARLDEAQIANARVNEMHEVWAHEQLRARGRWTDVATSAGRIPALLPPGLPEGFTPRMDPVPALGEHTHAILSELGYDSTAIERLRSERAI